MVWNREAAVVSACLHFCMHAFLWLMAHGVWTVGLTVSGQRYG
jgi:hypothetical protein